MNLFKHVDFSSVVTTCETNSDCWSWSGLIVALDRSWATSANIWGGSCRNPQLCRPNLEMRFVLVCFALCARNRKALLAALSISFWRQRALSASRNNVPHLVNAVSVSKFVEGKRHQEESRVFSGRSMMCVFWSLFPRLRRSWISHIPWSCLHRLSLYTFLVEMQCLTEHYQWNVMCFFFVKDWAQRHRKHSEME